MNESLKVPSKVYPSTPQATPKRQSVESPLNISGVLSGTPSINDLLKLFEKVKKSNNPINCSETIWRLMDKFNENKFSADYINQALKGFNQILGSETPDLNNAILWQLGEGKLSNVTAQGLANFVSSQLETVDDAEKLMSKFAIKCTDHKFKNTQEFKTYLENIRRQFSADSVIGKILSRAIDRLSVNSVPTVIQELRIDVNVAFEAAKKCVGDACKYSDETHEHEHSTGLKYFNAALGREKGRMHILGPWHHHLQKMRGVQLEFNNAMDALITELEKQETLATSRQLAAQNAQHVPVKSSLGKELNKIRSMLVKIDQALADLSIHVAKMEQNNVKLVLQIYELKVMASAMHEKADLNQNDLGLFKASFVSLQRQIEASGIC